MIENGQPSVECSSSATWNEEELTLLSEIGRALSPSVADLANEWTDRVFTVVSTVLPDSVRSREEITSIHRVFLESHLQNLRERAVDRIFPSSLAQLVAFLRRQLEKGGELRTTLSHLFFSLEALTTLLSEHLVRIHSGDPRLPAMIAALGKVSLVLSHAAGTAFYEVRSGEMQEALRIASSLLETSFELNAPAGSVQNVLAKLTRIVQRLVRADMGLALLWKESENAYVAQSGSGFSASDLEDLKSYRFRRSDFPVMADVFDGKPTARRLSEGGVPTEFMERFGPSAYAVAPMSTSQGKRLGSLVACRSEAVPFSSSDLEILRGVAQNAALAVENAMLVEELEAILHGKSDFIRSMSHEIRSPLHVLIGYLEVLLDRCREDSEAVDLVQRMQWNASYLLKLVNGVLSAPAASPAARGPLPTREIRGSRAVEGRVTEEASVENGPAKPEV